MTGRSARETWEAALGELQLRVSKDNFRTWLHNTVGLAIRNGQFVVGVPSIFASEWLHKRLHKVIQTTLSNITGQPLEVCFEVFQGGEKMEEAQARAPAAGTAEGRRLNPRYTFDCFIEGSCNRLARAAALSVAEHPGASYNPLFIYSGVGLGKTHLLHAIGHVVLPSLPAVLYVTAEQFTNEFITAIRERRTEDFRAKHRSVDVLLIDDVQFIGGKEQTEEALFHTFNDLHNANRQIVLSSDRSPKSLTLLEDRLRSRFEWGLIVEMQPPALETRLAILQAKAEEQQAHVPGEVLEFVARRAQKNIRELEGSLNRVIAYARLTKSPITPELAAQALADLTAEAMRRKLTALSIINTIAGYFNLEPDALAGKRRDKNIALARHIAMYLLREELQYQWSEIGRVLGKRDHSTILHGYHKVAAEMSENDALRRDILDIRELLYSKSE